MSPKIYLNILRFGVYLSLIIVFFVFKNLLFPFITSKQIPFNILVEILTIFWIAFIIKYPEYRPKKSWISFGLLMFLAAITISCFTGVDFNLSFWGDIERMLGVFHIAHFIMFYFIVITVFREWKDWKILFIVSIIIADFVSFKGLAGKAYSTIGNTAYVSGYLIFNIYFAWLLFVKEEVVALKPLYLIAIIPMLLEFDKANTSGAFVGLGFSILVLLFLYVVLSKNKKVKRYSLVAFVILTILTTLLFVYKDSNFVKHNSILRVATGISFKKNTFQTRLISWRAALKDFKNHPILGTGHGNYAIIFDKYFDPKFYNYTRSETYFDRAHNNLIDIASTAGIIGLLAYLSIFIALAYYLITGFRRGQINIHEFILVSSLIIAYFVQNLAVFDSFVTYIALMFTLGYIYWLVNKEAIEKVEEKEREWENKEVYALFFSAVILLTILYQYNWKVYKMLDKTISGQIAYSQGNVVKSYEEYQKALSYNTVLDRDSRTSFIRLILSNPGALHKINPEKAKEILDYAIQLAEDNIKYNSRDSLSQMLLAQVLNEASMFYSKNPEKFQYYSDRALEAINKSIEASPGRIPVYFQKAQIYITRGEKDKALETLQYAYNLNPDYFDSSCQLSKVYFYYDDKENGFKWADECIDKGGARILAPKSFVKGLLGHYIEKKDWKKVVELYKRLTRLEPKNEENWINLAKLYKQLGENQKAIRAAQKAAELKPGLQSYVDEFVRQLENSND